MRCWADAPGPIADAHVTAGRSLDVGVIGCGTAGAAAALFLVRAGHRVTVYERVEDPGPVGAGIMLQPTGQAVLDALGLHDEVVDRGARIDRLRCVTRAGRSVVDLAYRDLDPRFFGVGLHRGVLFASLFAAVKREPIALRLGVPIDALSRSRDGTFVVANGERHGPHDLIVVADGARSAVRDPHVARSNAEYPWGALWCVAEDPDRLFHTDLHQIVDGNERMLGLLPTGVGPTGSTPLVSIFWSIRGDRVGAWREAGLDAWKDEVRAFEPKTDPLLATITRPEQLLFATYHDVVMSRWNTHDAVYVGDAAHAMSPQLGQGCNLALYDAYTLAQCVAEHDDVPTALTAYSAARTDHLRVYQLATRWLTPFFQSDTVALGWIRDLGMGTMTRIPFFARTMTASMVGILTGVFSRVELPRRR